MTDAPDDKREKLLSMVHRQATLWEDLSRKAQGDAFLAAATLAVAYRRAILLLERDTQSPGDGVGAG
jgi:hypothetical protein